MNVVGYRISKIPNETFPIKHEMKLFVKIALQQHTRTVRRYGQKSRRKLGHFNGTERTETHHSVQMYI